MEQPKCFVAYGQEHLVCRLRKTLYGLKQAPDNGIRSLTTSSSRSASPRAMRTTASSPKQLKTGLPSSSSSTWTTCYSPVDMLTELIRKLRLKFAMKDLSPARHILGMKISQHRDKRQLFLSQTDYIGRVLEHFNIQSAMSASTPLPINLRCLKATARHPVRTGKI